VKGRGGSIFSSATTLGYWIAGLPGIAPAAGILGFVVAAAGAVPLILNLRLLGAFRKS
jgi:hypothetical protein